ncbi:MAG: SpoIIE family protein phosphatase [Clostridia bacterium]|nr:SpoIIE family protein phosphatase [Clostridia bacterium]
MYLMMLKMTGMTALYVLVTVLIWTLLRGRKPGPAARVAIGIVYGLLCVLSTHFGVDYGHMLLNVRDMGPLAAGLFFSPLSGILSGLIGGAERYIAGTYWGIGAYTRIACSVSTCLAGLLSAFLHVRAFGGKKPAAVAAFFTGAMMEIFHMYAIFITHRSDMRMAFYVVRNCSVPMIFFTALGLAACAALLQVLSHEWRNPFRVTRREDVSVSVRFQRGLFVVMMAVFLVNFLLSYLLQTSTAVQNANKTLSSSATGLRTTYSRLRSSQMGMDARAEAQAMTSARTIANAVRSRGGVEAADEGFLEDLRTVNGMEAVQCVSGSGEILAAVQSEDGEKNLPALEAIAAATPAGVAAETLLKLDSNRVAISVRCGAGQVRVVMDMGRFSASVMKEIEAALSVYNVGESGTYDLVMGSGRILLGDHIGEALPEAILGHIEKKPVESTFIANAFGEGNVCRIDRLETNLYLLTMLPTQEIYLNRDMQIYEAAFEDIMVFTAVYMLIAFLVQRIVVKNLTKINASLARITNGDLNEVVSVNDSTEFVLLSRDINVTVHALKGYIAAAQKRIEQELELARTIQASALPRDFTFPRGEFEIYALMDPAKEVGGDFYDFFYVGEDRMALVIADVSGKGIPAALFMMRSKTAIRSLAESGSSPAEIFYRVNNELCEGNDAEMFVTAWIGIIDLASGVMCCANAGHEYPAIRRAGGAYELLKDQHSLVLAAMENMRTHEYEIRLNPGDCLFVYTDGVPESINPEKEQYGTDRMLKMLDEVRDWPVDEVLPAIRQDVERFAAGEDQFDDITMLGFVYRRKEGGREPETERREGHEAADTGSEA